MKILKIFNSDILIRELFVKQTTTNGLYNPNAGKEHAFRVGTIVMSDSEKHKVGATIQFGIYAGVTVMHDGKEHVIITEKDVAAEVDTEGEFVEKEQR